MSEKQPHHHEAGDGKLTLPLPGMPRLSLCFLTWEVAGGDTYLVGLCEVGR
jgi:hypothetical protein